MRPANALAVLVLLGMLAQVHDGNARPAGPTAGGPAAGPGLPLRDGFEDGSPAGFWLPGDYGSGLYAPGAITLSKEHARAGAHSVRITVKEGDIPQPGDDGKLTERAELDSGHHPFIGRDVWYGFSFLVPEGFPVVDDRLVISSCKQTDLGAPLLAQRYRNGRHYFTVRDPRAEDERRTFDLPKIPSGRWVDMVYHVRYSPLDDGLVEVWMNGKRVVSHNGPLTDPAGKDRVYHKIGLYRDRWKQPMTMFYENYTLGEGYEAVDPARFAATVRNGPRGG